MYLAKNLQLKELTKSDTAIKNGLDNYPTVEHLVNLTILANNVFQPLRDAMGAPVFISSGYRSEKLNELIGGSTTSQHSTGQAIDIDQDNRNSKISNSEIFDYIRYNLEFDQLIWEFGDDNEPDWVHVSYKVRDNRNQVLQAIKENGKTKYLVI